MAHQKKKKEQPGTYCPRIFFSHSAKELVRCILFSKKCGENVEKVNSVDKGFVQEIGRPHDWLPFALCLRRSLPFVETTEQLVEIAALATSHDWLRWPLEK